MAKKKFVLLYKPAADAMFKALEHYEAHRNRLNEFYQRGVLLMAGTWADPSEGAMGIFTSREAAEEFVEGDPFVVNGVITVWTLREWNEILS